MALTQHLMEFPASRETVTEDGRVIPRLLEFVQSRDARLSGFSRECLALCGHVKRPTGDGIRILAIDGGGTRGMVALEVLSELERRSNGKKIHELFDIIVGVSTGSIIASLLGAKRRTIDEAKDIYKTISRQLFNSGWVQRSVGAVWSGHQYDTDLWIKTLKSQLGEDFTLLQTARDESTPRICVLSCIVNAPSLQPFIFRNYDYPPGSLSHYRGSTRYKLWEAVQASTAAPYYFRE
ncbi:Protein Y73B6BL.4, partial [Aphelenchoides avenae]